MTRLSRSGHLLALCLLLAACGRQGADDGQGADTTTADMDALRAEVTRLQAEVDKVRDTQAIKRLQRSFGYYMEEMLIDEIVALFTEDATWEFARDGVYRGKDRIRAWLLAMNAGQAGLAQGQLNETLQLMPAITLSADGRHARGRWRAIRLIGEHGGQALWGEGPYENEYVKEDGVWKISALHWHQTILVPYDGAWGRHEDVNQGQWVSDRLPPDAPPSYDAGYWPTTFLPPFSFSNPVGRYEPAAAPDANAANAANTGGAP